MYNPIKSALHHWWPRSLSKFWAGTDGKTYQRSWNGELAHAPPAKFGAIKNAHNIKLGRTPSPWDESFEKAFGYADTQFPTVIKWLQELKTSTEATDTPFLGRLEAHSASEKMLNDLSICLASLIVRGPAFRNSIRSTTEYYRKKFGMINYEAEDSLIGLNMKHCQDLFSKAITARGKFVALISPETEIIFGDGFLHNFSSPANAPNSPLCLVPLTPSICVLFVHPLGYRSDPRLMTMNLTPREAKFLNDTVQIYSRDFIFYRKAPPTIIEEFSRREFRQYEFHKHPWLDELIETIATFYIGKSLD